MHGICVASIYKLKLHTKSRSSQVPTYTCIHMCKMLVAIAALKHTARIGLPVSALGSIQRKTYTAEALKLPRPHDWYYAIHM